MVILDTNVISEFMQQKPNEQVVKWVDKIATKSLFTTWINIAEINRGIAKLPEGKRQLELHNNFIGFINSAFSDRILAFEQIAAGHFGQLCTMREKQGLNVDPIDLMIVAIAKKYQYKIATRNERDFLGCGIDVINPWTV